MNFKLIKNILMDKEDGKELYSQARIYLLGFMVTLFVVFGILIIGSLRPSFKVSMIFINPLIDVLKWGILLLSGYAMGTKAVSVVQNTFGRRDGQIQQPDDDGDVQPEVAQTDTGAQKSSMSNIVSEVEGAAKAIL